VLALTILVTVLTLSIQPQVGNNLREHPWGFVFPALALTGLTGSFLYRQRGQDLRAFLASCAFIAGMLTSAVFGVYPNVLPSSGDPALALTIYNSAAPHYGLTVGLVWFIPGLLLASAYFFFLYRHFAHEDGVHPT
jgi:cytochrome d ubiquinol oxidase subunit II